MNSIVEMLKALQCSYSGAFVLFWGAALIACVGVWILEWRKNALAFQIEGPMFWAFGLAMVAFAALRPVGIAHDDIAYLEIYKGICPTLTCHQWIQGSRDWGWYSLVGFLKSFVSDPRLMLGLGAAALLIKLGVIYSLTRRPLLVLLLYLGLFYEVQDLTAWRASLAIAFFMAAVWLVARTRTYWNAWALFSCGLFHKQAVVAPLILVGNALKRSRWLLLVVCLAPTFLMILGVYPELQAIVPYLSAKFQQIAINQGLDSYIAAKNAGAYLGWRNAPLVVYPQVLLILWLAIRDRSLNDCLKPLLTGCLAMGCLFLWGFASLPDAQGRFFDFFMVPTVLLAGMRRLNALECAGVFAVSGAFVIKYNVLHHLLV